MLRSTGLVNKAAILVLFAVPKSVDAAMLAVLLPEGRIDVASGVERSHELVAAAGGTLWKLLRSGKSEPNALEHMWQCHRSISFGRSKLRLIRHVGTAIDPRRDRTKAPDLVEVEIVPFNREQSAFHLPQL
jgi:hypothetical protein